MLCCHLQCLPLPLNLSEPSPALRISTCQWLPVLTLSKSTLEPAGPAGTVLCDLPALSLPTPHLAPCCSANAPGVLPQGLCNGCSLHPLMFCHMDHAPPQGNPPRHPRFDQLGSSAPCHWLFLHSRLAHSPLRILGVWLQDHILALLVDVDTHGVRGEPDGVCAHLWVLQGIADHTAFAAFALND